MSSLLLARAGSAMHALPYARARCHSVPYRYPTDGARAERTMAVVIEALCGWVGFLGVGYLLRGRIGTGLGLMVLWWLVLGMMFFAGLLTLGAGLACAGPVWFVVPILSRYAVLLGTNFRVQV